MLKSMLNNKHCYFIACLSFILPTFLSIPLILLAKSDRISYQAESLQNAFVEGQSCKKLEGNVYITMHPSGIILTADQAFVYDEEDKIRAIGHVQIRDKKNNLIQGDQLTYYPEQKLAFFEKNVICHGQDVTLHMGKFIYNTQNQKGKFEERGKLIQGQRVLTSMSGIYNGDADSVTFLQEVVLTESDYTLHSDYLCYHIKTEAVAFQGITKVVWQDSSLTTEQEGAYCPAAKKLTVAHGVLTNKDVVLSADHLEIYDAKDYKAVGHVKIQATAYAATIVGKEASYTSKTGKSVITGEPLFTKLVHNAPLYLRADTFTVWEKVDQKGLPTQEMHALGNVKLYQESIQGITDGAIYNSTEGTVQFHNQPVIWCSGYQITGEEVSLALAEEGRGKLFVNKNIFMVSADCVGNYNQIRGHKMIADFKDNVVEKMSIEGSGESLYFLLRDDNELIGMNHVKADKMEMTIEEHTLAQMVCTPSTTGAFYPADLLKQEQMKLADFVWHADKWPTKENMLPA